MDTTGARSPLKRTVGSNQVGMRQFNERIVLQAIRLHGPLPKADGGSRPPAISVTVHLKP